MTSIARKHCFCSVSRNNIPFISWAPSVSVSRMSSLVSTHPKILFPNRKESSRCWARPSRHLLHQLTLHAPSLRRNLSLTNIFESDDSRSMVESYSPHGFVVNGMLMQGSVILLSNTQLVWNVRSLQDITWESLAVLQVLKQKPGESSHLTLHTRA